MARRRPPIKEAGCVSCGSGELVEIGRAFSDHDPGEKPGTNFVTEPTRNRGRRWLFAGGCLNRLGGRRANGGSAYFRR